MHWLCAGHFVNTPSSTLMITLHTFHRKVISACYLPKATQCKRWNENPGGWGKERNRWGRIRDTNFQLQNKSWIWNVQCGEVRKKNPGLLEGDQGKSPLIFTLPLPTVGFSSPLNEPLRAKAHLISASFRDHGKAGNRYWNMWAGKPLSMPPTSEQGDEAHPG